MAITIPNSTTHDTGFTSTHTFSAFDCSGTNSCLLVMGANKNPATEVTGITADGNAMALIDSNINANVVAVQGWNYEINDSSFDIVVSTPGFKEWAGVAINLNGVDQTTNFNATTVKAQGFGTTATAAITGTAGSMLMVLGSTQTDKTLTASSCTQLQNFNPTSGIGSVFVGYVEATGSSQTIGFTINANDNYRLLIIEYYAASTTTTSTSSTSSSISTSSTSTSLSTSSTSSSVSTSTSSTSTSVSTSSTSSSISTSSTSSSISTSSTSSSVSTSISTSSTSSSVSTSISTSSTSSSISVSTSSTSSSISTSSTSSSVSTSTSSTSSSISTSTSTSSTSTSVSTSTSISTSSTSSSVSTSISTSSTSSSLSTSVSTSSTSVSISTSSTSTSTTTVAGNDVNVIPRATIRPFYIRANVRTIRPYV